MNLQYCLEASIILFPRVIAKPEQLGSAVSLQVAGVVHVHEVIFTSPHLRESLTGGSQVKWLSLLPGIYSFHFLDKSYWSRLNQVGSEKQAAVSLVVLSSVLL